MFHAAGIFANIYPLNDPNVGKYTLHGAYGLEYVKSRSPGFIPCHPPLGRETVPFSPSRTMGDCRHPWDIERPPGQVTLHSWVHLCLLNVEHPRSVKPWFQPYIFPSANRWRQTLASEIS